MCERIASRATPTISGLPDFVVLSRLVFLVAAHGCLHTLSSLVSLSWIGEALECCCLGDHHSRLELIVANLVASWLRTSVGAVRAALAEWPGWLRTIDTLTEAVEAVFTSVCELQCVCVGC